MHVSIICHEIFHNIAMMVGIYGGKIYNAFKKAFYISAEIYQALLQILLGSLGKYAKELNIERSEHEEAFSKTEKNFKILSDIIDDPDQVQAFIEKIAGMKSTLWLTIETQVKTVIRRIWFSNMA
jgi:hypothetical protein